MKKLVKAVGNAKKLNVTLLMSYSEFQDLRSMMNILSDDKNWDLYNKVCNNAPLVFYEMLKEI